MPIFRPQLRPSDNDNPMTKFGKTVFSIGAIIGVLMVGWLVFQLLDML